MKLAPSGSNRKARTDPLAPLGPEGAAAVLLGPGVLLVDEAAAGRAAAVLGHPGEACGRCGRGSRTDSRNSRRRRGG